MISRFGTPYSLVIFSLFAAVIFIGGALFFAANAAACNLYGTNSTPPSGYGAAYDVFDSAKRLLLTMDCGTSGATFTVGYGNSSQIIYNEGWKYTGDANNPWQKIFFTGNTKYKVGNIEYPWYRGTASAAVSSSLIQSGTNYIVAYVCTAQGGVWKCGCRDATCATSHWQLQAFQFAGTSGGDPNLPVNPRGDCLVNANADYCYYPPKCLTGDQDFNAPGNECFYQGCTYVGKRDCCTVNGALYCEACYTHEQGRLVSPKCEQIRG